MRLFHIIFYLLSFLGEQIIGRPNRVVYALLVIFSVISHLTAVLIVLAVFCYAYRGWRHAVH